MRRWLPLAVALIISFPGSSYAQARRTVWGVSGGFTPNWSVPSQFKIAFGVNAEAVDFGGSEFRIGFVRGRMLEGDWGVSFIKKRFDEAGKITLEGGTIYSTTKTTALTGFEAHRFASFATIRDRVQIGMNLAIGAAWLRGTVYKADSSGTAEVKAMELFPPRDKDIPMPIGKVEFAVAGIIAPGLKVRAAGGLNFPGYETFSFTVVYLIGVR